MIPLRDNIPTRRFPLISVIIILINVGLFLMDQLTGHYVQARVRIPGEGIALVRHFVGGFSDNYAMVPAQVTSNFAENWPTIFTSMFLHANWLHVGGNMLMLWVFGNNVEDTLGRIRYLLFYLFCGIAAAVAQIYSGPGSELPMVGASGAIAGLMGAYIVLFPRAEILTIVPIFFFGWITEVPAIIVIGVWAVLQYVNASFLGGGGMLRGGGVAYFAHLGGFAAGIMLILFMGGRNLVRPAKEEWVQREEW